MGFFDSIFHHVGDVVSTVSHAISGGVSKAIGLVQHAKVVDFARKAGDNLVDVGKQVVGKASDVVTTVYSDAKGLASKPFEVLSNPFTMIAVGIAGIAGIMILTKV
jgi:hypothetical protein